VIPLEGYPTLRTAHVECLTWCVTAAVRQLRQGGKARVKCPDTIQEVELLAVGDKSLFVEDLGLATP